MKLKIAFVLILGCGNAFGQKDSVSNSFIRLNYENDYFTTTDDYYTQGIKLEVASPAFRYSPFMWLLPALSNSAKQYTLSAVQDCFTPAFRVTSY
jgi:lipid A 3-O-deacylase